MSLATAKEWLLSDTCIISYSDIVYSEKTVERLLNGVGDILITYDPSWLNLWSLRFDEPLSDAETFKLNKDSDLIEIGGRANSVEEIEGQFMGLLKFTPKGWGAIEKYLGMLNQETLDKMDMTKLLKGLIISGEKIGAIPIDEPWYEIDNENDLNQYLKPGVFKL
jgi:choline kinase